MITGAKSGIRTDRKWLAVYGALMTAAVAAWGYGNQAYADDARNRTPSQEQSKAGSVGVANERDIQLSQMAQRDFDIPAQSLTTALTVFGQQSGLQVTADGALLRARSTSGVRGRMTPDRALERLLAGTGLTYSVAGSTVTVGQTAAQQGGGPMQLGPITVEGESESAVGPVDGYVARRSLTGTKTNTPLIETPQSISIITRDQLDALDADTLNDALRYTPGATGEVFGNDSRVDFLQYRGFDENGNGVYRDGLQLRSTAFAEFRPELYGAQRVEVLRGPASALYGQSAPGGIINVVTKRPPTEVFAEVKAEFGSFEHKAGMFDIGGPIMGSKKVQARLTGLIRDSDTQVDFIEDDSQFIAPALTLRPSTDTTFTILGHYQRDRTGATNQFLPASGTLTSNPNGTVPTSRFIGEPDFDKFDRDAASIGYLFEHQFNETFTVRQNARYDYLDVTYDTAFGGGLQADQRTLTRFAFEADGRTDLFTVDTHVQASFVTGPAAHTLLFGIDYQRFDVEDVQRFGSAPSIDIFNPVYGATVPLAPISTDLNIVQDQIGIYAQEQVKLFDKLVLTLSGRQDLVDSDRKNNRSNTRTSQDDSEFTYRVGGVFLSDFGFAPYATYAQSFLPIVGTNLNGDVFEPETGDLYEIGVKFQPAASNSSVTVSLFNLTRQNVQTTDPNNAANTIQTGEVRSRGVELEGIASFDFGLDVIASYTYQDVEITKSNRGDQGNRPTTVPQHVAALWADYKIPDGPLGGLGLGAGVRYKGTSFGDAANTLTVDDFVLVDAAVHYDWRGLRAAINVENLLDNRHVTSCSSANACFYGTDRTVVGSVRYRW